MRGRLSQKYLSSKENMKQSKTKAQLCESFALQPSCLPWAWLIPCLLASGSSAHNNTWTQHTSGIQALFPSSTTGDQGKASTVQNQKVSESESFSLYPSSEPTLLLHRLTMLPRLERVVLLKLSFLKQTKLTAVIVLEGEKVIMVARMRARQSATSLLGAQARAGVWPGRKCRQGSG